jgi:hypothetical protein
MKWGAAKSENGQPVLVIGHEVNDVKARAVR